MSKYEKGNWPAQSTKAILRSVEKVLTAGSIQYLTKAAYLHITLHMGFIAHYDLHGFMNTYADVADFAEHLLTSEYSQDLNYNQNGADHYSEDCFVRDYGKVYCQSVIDCNRGVVALAKAALYGLQQHRSEEIKESELAELHRLAAKYNIAI